MMSEQIPPKLITKIAEKSKLKKSAIYDKLAKKIAEYNGLISKRAAAVLVAADFKIASYKYLSPEDKETLIKIKAPQVFETGARIKVIEKEKVASIVSLRGISVFDPFLPSKLLEEAIRMAEKCYPLLYVYENSIRNVIRILMERKYGPDWWDIRVKQLHGNIDARIEGRIKEEADERWHSSKRGVHKIFYTDLDDLRKIIDDDWDLFKKIHPRKSWVIEHIMQPNHSRNIIAHNNPLSNRDIASIQTKIREWLDQIKGIN